MKRHKEKRPWGKFERFTLNEKSSVKIISVNAGKRLSLQYHKKRKEFWRVLSGKGRVTIGNKILNAKKGDEFIVKTRQKHRIEALGEGIVILEISFGKFDENDIVRLEDDFGRI